MSEVRRITGSPSLQPDPLFLELHTGLSCLFRQRHTIILLPPDTTMSGHYHSLNSFHLDRLIALIRRQGDKWFIWQFELVWVLKSRLLQAIKLSFLSSQSQLSSSNSAMSLKRHKTMCPGNFVQCHFLHSNRARSNYQTDRQNESHGKDQMKVNQSVWWADGLIDFHLIWFYCATVSALLKVPCVILGKTF